MKAWIQYLHIYVSTSAATPSVVHSPQMLVFSSIIFGSCRDLLYD